MNDHLTQAIQKIKDIRDELYRRKITERKLTGTVSWVGDDGQLVIDIIPGRIDYDALKQIAANTRSAVYAAWIRRPQGDYNPGSVYFTTSSKLHNNVNATYQKLFGSRSVQIECNNDYTGLINIPDEMVRTLGDI